MGSAKITPRTVTTAPNRTVIRTIAENSSLASLSLPPPSLREMTTLPPAPTSTAADASIFVKGTTRFRPASASGETKFATKMPSIMMYIDIKTIMTMVGSAKTSRDFAVCCLVRPLLIDDQCLLSIIGCYLLSYCIFVIKSTKKPDTSTYCTIPKKHLPNSK